MFCIRVAGDWSKTVRLRSTCLIAVGSVILLASSGVPAEAQRPTPAEVGKQLYTQHCAACHGETGDGNGTAARFLSPKPRNFRAGYYRLVSTQNGVPTVDDIVAVLDRGMPGSSMPPWPALGDVERRLLAAYIKDFRKQEIRAQEVALAAEDGEKVDEEELQEILDVLTIPGEAVKFPAIAASSAAGIARGKAVFLKAGCASCHGNEGKGDGGTKQVTSEGLPIRPRDLTQGVFKGSPDLRSVYIRTQAGMPGTPMPATSTLTHEQISDLVHFVLSLSDEATRSATVLTRLRQQMAFGAGVFDVGGQKSSLHFGFNF